VRSDPDISANTSDICAKGTEAVDRAKNQFEANFGKTYLYWTHDHPVGCRSMPSMSERSLPLIGILISRPYGASTDSFTVIGTDKEQDIIIPFSTFTNTGD